MTQVVCPFCGAAFFKSDIGIASHLRKHIRDGLMNKDDYHKYRMMLVNQPIKGEYGTKEKTEPRTEHVKTDSKGKTSDPAG